MSQTFAKIVDEVHLLDTDAKQELFDMLQSWLIEERRKEIAHSAKRAKFYIRKVKRNPVTLRT